jgi:hypothetical protein
MTEYIYIFTYMDRQYPTYGWKFYMNKDKILFHSITKPNEINIFGFSGQDRIIRSRFLTCIDVLALWKKYTQESCK